MAGSPHHPRGIGCFTPTWLCPELALAKLATVPKGTSWVGAGQTGTVLGLGGEGGGGPTWRWAVLTAAAASVPRSFCSARPAGACCLACGDAEAGQCHRLTWTSLGACL